VPIWRVWRKNERDIVLGRWLTSLKEEENIHNTAAALREAYSRRPIGPDVKHKTPITDTDKTDKTLETDELGLVATWSVEFGYVSIHDPSGAEGVWWDLKTTDAPGWAVSEARRRKEIYRDGNRRAYRLTSREMEEIWEAGLSDLEVGIVEDYPIEDG
jgi:hypothetical protein